MSDLRPNTPCIIFKSSYIIKTDVRIYSERRGSMKDGYMDKAVKLDALAEVLILVANDFEKGIDVEKAITGYVLCGMILKQLEAIDEELLGLPVVRAGKVVPTAGLEF